jgi:hypothetical protein
MSQSSTRYIGLDVPKEAIACASGAQDQGAEVTYRGTRGTRHCAIDLRLHTRQSQAKPRVFVYVAGPCEYWLYRSLTHKG